MKLYKHFAGLLLTLLSCTQLPAAEPAKPELLVYAAASLTNVLEAVGRSYQNETGQAVKFSFAASSTLARQLEAGARADVFFTADTDWMDYAQSRGLINADSRRNLLGNRLALIAPADSKVQLRIAPNFALAAALGTSRLSMGDPDSVPAGKYGRSALTALGVWSSVADKLVLGDSVRTALAFVDRGEAPLGIVYETDALIDNKVRIVDFFPASTHAPIVYPIALTGHAGAGADKFVAFLRAANSQATFRKYGFSILP